MSAAHPYVVDILGQPVWWVLALIALVPALGQFLAFIVFGRRADRSQKARDAHDAADREGRVAATRTLVAAILRNLRAAADMIGRHALSEAEVASIWQTSLLEGWPGPGLLAEAYSPTVVRHLDNAYAAARTFDAEVSLWLALGRGKRTPPRMLNEAARAAGEIFDGAWAALPVEDQRDFLHNSKRPAPAPTVPAAAVQAPEPTADTMASPAGSSTFAVLSTSYLVFLGKGANDVLRGLFPHTSNQGSLYIGVSDEDIGFTDLGIEVPARPDIVDTATGNTRVQEGRLTIPWRLVDYWFAYERSRDKKALAPPGFYALDTGVPDAPTDAGWVVPPQPET